MLAGQGRFNFLSQTPTQPATPGRPSAFGVARATHEGRVAHESGSMHTCAAMPHDVPTELATMLDAPEGRRRDDAWGAFVQRYSRLLLHVSRSHGGDRDTVMDRYAFILDRLRSDDCRRLRTWTRDRRSKFTTWLTVVAQRTSLDLYRQRYGRPRDASSVDSRMLRRRLADLLSTEIADEQVAPGTEDGEDGPEQILRASELIESLHDAVAELSTADQLLLTLRFRDALSAAEIARLQGLPSPFHVYRRLDRLLGRLREALKRRGVEDPAP